MLATLLDKGGWVMGPLLVLSVIAITLCIERMWFWWHTQRFGLSGNRLTNLVSLLRAGQFEKVAPIISNDKTVYGWFIRHLIKFGWTESVAVEAVETLRPRLERFMPALSTIITAAPLLGILGTVSGIIGSFQLLGESRLVTDPREVSGGIAEALLTTEVGLIIALVTLFPFMLYRARIDRTLAKLEMLIAAGQHGTQESESAPSEESSPANQSTS